jgi:hypothetical protein
MSSTTPSQTPASGGPTSLNLDTLKEHSRMEAKNRNEKDLVKLSICESASVALRFLSRSAAAQSSRSRLHAAGHRPDDSEARLFDPQEKRSPELKLV